MAAPTKCAACAAPLVYMHGRGAQGLFCSVDSCRNAPSPKLWAEDLDRKLAQAIPLDK